jgi:hypothetical protein
MFKANYLLDHSLSFLCKRAFDLSCDRSLSFRSSLLFALVYNFTSLIILDQGFLCIFALMFYYYTMPVYL